MLDLSGEFSAFADTLDAIVSGPSIEGRPAGSSDAGSKFEQAIGLLWQDFARVHRPTLQLVRVNAPNTHGRTITAYCLRNPINKAEMFFPPVSAVLDSDVTEEGTLPESWLRRKFLVSELIEGHLGQGPYSFAPPTPRDSPNYYGPHYPELYTGRTTNFDWSVALADNGMIVEKMLFEYKSAKSSGLVLCHSDYEG